METTTMVLDGLELRLAGDHHEAFLRCVPYGVTTTRTKTPERMLAGAFQEATAAASKIRLTDENHANGRRPVGVGLALEDRPDGLYGRFRFYNTPEGRAALENVQEGTYGGVSVGFVAVQERMAAGVREIVRARLHHVSLVDTPAYEDAEILSVRSADRFAYLLTERKTLDIPDVPLLTPLITPRR